MELNEIINTIHFPCLFITHVNIQNYIIFRLLGNQQEFSTLNQNKYVNINNIENIILIKL
jgi:hypothetical protein